MQPIWRLSARASRKNCGRALNSNTIFRRRRLRGELESATMLLFPTRADTSPNAVKESVVAGVPVVASNVGGIPDYVFPGHNGVLFEAGDLSGFVSAIRKACSHPLLGQGKVEPETFARTRDYLSPERMAKNFRKAYRMTSGD